MLRVALHLGARAETLAGLSGLGDLVLTCTGDLSRNREVGVQLSRGLALGQVLERLGHVAEGLHLYQELQGRKDPKAQELIDHYDAQYNAQL